MNLYVIVEGDKTELSVYPSWMKYLAPQLNRIDDAWDVSDNNYYLFSGGGIPHIYNHVTHALEDIISINAQKEHGYDYLLVCMDTEESNRHSIEQRINDDLTKADGNIYDNIIFIGENGVGKSTIIEGMANFLNKKDFPGLEYIKYEVNGEELKAILVGSLGFYDMVTPDGSILQMHTNSNNHNSRVDDDQRNIRFTGCMISKARANFQVGNINATE